MYNTQAFIKFRVFVSFSKKLFNSSDTSDTKVSSVMTLWSTLKSYFVYQIFLLRIKRLDVFPKSFVLCNFVDIQHIKKNLCSFLHNLLQKFLCFLYFLKDQVCLFLKQTFSKYDVFIIAFLNALIKHGAWFSQSTFYFNGACLFRTPDKFSLNLVW